MIRIAQYIFFGLTILLGTYFFNKKDDNLTKDKESRSIASNTNQQSVLDTVIKNKEIPEELIRSLAMATPLLNEKTSDLQGDIESDLPIIEEKLKNSPYPNELFKRYDLIVKLSQLINKNPPSDNQLTRIKTLLKNELMNQNYSDLEDLTVKEKDQKLKILETAFQLNVQLETSLNNSMVEAVQVIRFQKDHQIRTTLLQNFISMNPTKVDEILKWTAENQNASPSLEDIEE